MDGATKIRNWQVHDFASEHKPRLLRYDLKKGYDSLPASALAFHSHGSRLGSGGILLDRWKARKRRAVASLQAAARRAFLGV
jgi:hypothetical protein